MCHALGHPVNRARYTDSQIYALLASVTWLPDKVDIKDPSGFSGVAPITLENTRPRLVRILKRVGTPLKDNKEQDPQDGGTKLDSDSDEESSLVVDLSELYPYPPDYNYHHCPRAFALIDDRSVPGLTLFDGEQCGLDPATRGGRICSINREGRRLYGEWTVKEKRMFKAFLDRVKQPASEQSD
jgi:hypothetical protein